MIGVEQWRASIGLYHPHSHRKLSYFPGERQLAPTPLYHLIVVILIASILAKGLVCCALIIIWIWINGYSLLKGGLTCIMASKKRTTQLLVSMCINGLTISEAISGCLERSISTMAILLLMAGDVERNPGPLPPASASPESRALRYHSASLITAIADPLRLSWKLFAAGMIEEATRDEAQLQIYTKEKKNSVLLSAVMSRVDTDPKLFHTFVGTLKNDGDDTLKSLGGKLEDTYNEFTKGDTEQHTQPSHSHPQHPHDLSQPPPQPKLDPYNFEEFQIHHASQPPPLHPHPSQPPPIHLHPSQSLPQLSQPHYQPSPRHPQPLRRQYPHDLSQPHPHPNLDPYDFKMHEFQIHHTSQPLPLHPHLSQPLPQLSQPHSQLSHYPQPLTTHSSHSHPQPSQRYRAGFVINNAPDICQHAWPCPSPLPDSTLTLLNCVDYSKSCIICSQLPTYPQPSHDPSHTHPHPNLDPYNFQMHLPHSQSPHLHLPPTKQLQHSPPPPVPQCPLLLFVSFLRSFYDSDIPQSYCKWPPVPKQKYINLAAISREKVTSKELKQFMFATLHGNVDQILETKAPVKLQEILNTKQGEKLHCVLVEGAPGVGKTTLSWEICKKWATGELFQQYTAVLLLKLRDRTVQNAKNIMDLIHYMSADEDEGSRTHILQHMKLTKGKDILVILEGLDELPKCLLNTDQPSIFTCLLSRTILPDATILVTSRPSATAQLLKCCKISRHIEVLGFTEKDIIHYIQSALPPQECPDFDSYLATNPNIRLTMYIPLNCAIVIEVYRSCQQSCHPPPKTTTELYTCLIQIILLRYLDSHPDYKDSTIDIDKFTDLPPPVYQHFYKLIQMAYDGVKSQQLTFHNQHTALQHLGFMDSVMELFSRPTKHSATYSYNFLHLSLQEYLAAYFISLQSMDMQQQLLQSTLKEQHLRNMGRFVAGITKYKGMDRATVKAVIEQECEKWSDGRLELSPYTLQLLHECGDYSIINEYSSYYLQLIDYSPLLDFAVLGHCITNTSYKWTLVLGLTGGIINYMQSTERMAMLVQTLKSHSNPSYTIECIECYYESPECVQCLLLELPQHALQHLQMLVLYSNSDNRHPLPLPVLEHILSKMSRLHTLELYTGAVSTTGAVAMAELIKNNNTLREVRVLGNAIGAKGKEALKKIRKQDLELSIH